MAALQFPCIIFKSALNDHILNDRIKNSTLLRIKNTLKGYINWEINISPTEKKDEFRKAINFAKLQKFDRSQDNFNGIGITVHNIWATHITVKSLQINNDRYRAVVHYKVQDHFGLDDNDILKAKFNQFRLFRIWFVLQRYNQFGFKPFMKNIEIIGDRNESGK